MQAGMKEDMIEKKTHPGSASALQVLEKCRSSVSTLNTLRRQRAILTARATDVSPHYSATPRTRGRITDRVGDLVPELDAVTRQIDTELRTTNHLLHISSALVQTLPTPTMQALARGYWLTGLSFADSARAVPLSSSYAWRVRERIETFLSQVEVPEGYLG